MSNFNIGAAVSAGAAAAAANTAGQAGNTPNTATTAQASGFDRVMEIVKGDIVSDILNDPIDAMLEEQIIGKAQADAEEAAANTPDGLEG